MKRRPVLIVGMARSGTTMVAHLFGLLKHSYLEIEPHMLWKAGDFKNIFDSDGERKSADVEWIRNNLMACVPQDGVLVEKSPVNCIRPNLVYKVFPEAKIVYLERDAVRCIYSNYVRSLQRDSLNPKITFKKYLLYTGSRDLQGAISKRKLNQQLRLRELHSFFWYSWRLFLLRNFNNLLPFGPKIRNFPLIIRNYGLLNYHVQVFKFAKKCKERFMELYKENFRCFRFENIQRDASEIGKMYQFAGFDCKDEFIELVKDTFDRNRILKSRSPSELDRKISELLNDRDFIARRSL